MKHHKTRILRAMVILMVLFVGLVISSSVNGSTVTTDSKTSIAPQESQVLPVVQPHDATIGSVVCTNCYGRGGCKYCMGNPICNMCNGSGYIAGSTVCGKCRGTGRCFFCNGTGICHICRGSGRIGCNCNESNDADQPVASTCHDHACVH